MSVAPHEPQNRCSVPLSAPQDGQVTTPSIDGSLRLPVCKSEAHDGRQPL
jgi:hypothetical protein